MYRRVGFECGKDPVQLPEGRFAIKFSTIAIFFILFDIELVFVWPWATMYRRLGWFGFVAYQVEAHVASAYRASRQSHRTA